MRNKPWYPVESADSVLRLLLLLSERQRLRVSDAAEHLGVARSTAHRLLRTLCARDFATQDAHRAYRPGPAFERIIRSGPATPDLRTLLHGHVEALHRKVDETCHLMVLEGNGTRFIDCAESPQVLRVSSRIGMLLPAHVTSGGKALLAELSAEEFADLYPRNLPGAPGAPAVDRATVRRQLATVRRRGYAVNSEESERGIVAVGACVRDGSGRAVAALAVAAPSARVPRARIPELASEVMAAARAATVDL
ncbi:IclR family transcriptional regulator [Streptomyces odontomachi]|uniref:IclR family transcriptional regulator n=1 Tax=Streptomyces odontomachi TaxID=2944940 RepID=UPI0021098368|nr:IclR family transcriptional regulator [Streptomyces sp. ODS25]